MIGTRDDKIATPPKQYKRPPLRLVQADHSGAAWSTSVVSLGKPRRIKGRPRALGGTRVAGVVVGNSHPN